MPRVAFLPIDRSVEVTEGTSILDAALDHDIPLNHNCGGNCSCSTCHVIIESGFDTLDSATEEELEMLEEADHLTERSRLACQVKIADDLVVRIPPGRVI